MRTWILALSLALAGCEGEAAPPSVPKPSPPAAIKPAPKPAEVKGDPAGKNLCLKCGLRTNEKACPECKETLVADPAAAPKATGEVGQSSLAPTYACPQEGCKFTSARKEKCITHADTDLKEQWYVCAQDNVRRTSPGKCGTCGGGLKSELR